MGLYRGLNDVWVRKIEYEMEKNVDLEQGFGVPYASFT